MLIATRFLVSTSVKTSLVNWLPWTPFYVSSDGYLVDGALALANHCEQLAGDIAFQATDGLQLGMALGDLLRHVGLGPRISPQSADGDNVQGTVSRPIAAFCQATPGTEPLAT